MSAEIRDLHKLIPKAVSYTSKRLTAPGENYGSTMLTLEVLLEDGEVLNCVAKMCPNNEWLKKMFCVEESFKKEIAMYKNIMPELEKFLQEHGCCLMNVLPECLGARLNLTADSDAVDDDAIILLENLKLRSFSVGNRMVGFDLATTKLVLRDLARFHAVPIAMKLLEKGRFDAKIRPYLNRVLPGQNLGEETGKQVMEKIISNGKRRERCVEYLDRCSEGMILAEKLFKDPLEVCEKYGTVVHNDFWVNNTMIRFEGDFPVENRMVDFQFYCYGSCVRDLIFFLYTSVEKVLFYEKFDTLVRFYFDRFIECLEELKCDTKEYTYESFQNEINSVAPTEFFHVIIMLRPVLAIEKNVMDLEEMNENVMLQDDIVSDLYVDCLADTIISFAKKKWI